MSKKSVVSPLFLAVLLLAAVIAYIYYPGKGDKAQRQIPVTPVVVHQVEMEDFDISIEALGTGKANESVLLTALNTEVVSDIHFDDGDLVEKGQLLLALNSREEKAKVNELQINLQEAKRQLKRISNLAKENAASAQLLDEQEAKVKALKAQLEVAETKLAELEVRAPFAGKLGIRQVSVGALVKPGDQITTLDDLHLMKVDFSIAEAHLPSVKQGQLVKALSVAYPGEVFEGEITSIDSRIDPVTRAIKVRASILNTELKLRPGMLLQINLQKQLLKSLVIPESAIVPIQDKQFVFVVDADDVVKQVEVKIGHRKPGLAQIESGLQEGDQVVVEGTTRISDGSKVKAVGDKAGA